jgi:hypothetical protein
MDSTFPGPVDTLAPIERQDARSRAIVDVGIAMQKYASTVSAVEFLRSQDIGAKVIERVLGEPARRRPT